MRRIYLLPVFVLIASALFAQDIPLVKPRQSSVSTCWMPSAPGRLRGYS